MDSTKKKSRYVVDKRAMWVSFLTVCALIVPTSIVHESGHMIVCRSVPGNTFNYHLTLSGAQGACEGTLPNAMFMLAAGGLFAAIVFAVPGVITAVASINDDYAKRSALSTQSWTYSNRGKLWRGIVIGTATLAISQAFAGERKPLPTTHMSTRQA